MSPQDPTTVPPPDELPALRRRVAELEQAQQAQKLEAVARLAAGVAHEFNNLLTAIAGHGELLLDGLRAGDPLAEHARQIRKAADRAAELTRQLMTFCRHQAGSPTVVDLNAVVAGMERLLARLLGEDVTLTAHCDPGLWPVWADAGQMEQTLLTLVMNARDAMPQGGRLTVETRNAALPGAEGPARHVLLAVRDTGRGMDRATRERLFEPFFTTKEVGKGLGLSLATVYGIVTQAGGHIEVESEVGQGATVFVYLPRLVAVAGPAEGAGPPAARGGETVLLVEDEEMVRGLARRILAAHGYAVLEARNGVQALEVAARHGGPIHLLLTDVVMPQLSGRQLADQLLPQRPAMRVLFMSGYADDTALRRGVYEAAADLLPKPFSPDALAHKVREVLDR